MDEIIILVKGLDWKLLLTCFALLVSLFSLRENKKGKEEQKKLRQHQAIMQIDAKLNDAWDLMGGDVASETIVLFNSNRELNLAKRLIAECEKLDANYAPVFRHWSLYYKGRNLLEKSLKMAQKAVQLDPENALTYNTLGAALYELSRYDEAEKVFRKAVDLDPEDAVAYTNLGMALIEMNQTDEAETAFRKSLELDNEDASVHIRLGMALSILQRFEEAVKAFRKSIKLNPEDSNAHELLGTSFCGMKRYTEAEKAFRKSIELNPENVRALYNLGFSLIALEISEDFNFKYEPEAKDGHSKLSCLPDRVGRCKEAVTAFRKCINLGYEAQNAKEYSESVLLVIKAIESPIYRSFIHSSRQKICI